MQSLKRSASNDPHNSSKRARHDNLMSSSSSESIPTNSTQGIPPVYRSQSQDGVWGYVFSFVVDLGKGFLAGLHSSKQPDHNFDFDQAPQHGPRPATRRRFANGASPGRTFSLSSTAASVASTSANQLQSSIDAHEQHLQLTRRLSGGIHKRRAGYRHIFADEHKRQVDNNMVKELHSLMREKGYGQDYATFEGFIRYTAVLLDQAKHDDGSELKSLQDPSNESLHLAIRKARQSLLAPRPPPPFHPTYDRLLNQSRRRDSEIEDRIRPKKRPLPSKLPPAIEKEVDAIFAKTGPISKCAREAVSSNDISRLRPGQWLNDEIINFYGAMILERMSAKDSHLIPTNGNVKGKTKQAMQVHYFSTFFWPKLNEGYVKSKLNRWTKKIDVFSKDIILIPINHGNAHWTAAAINFRRKRIESYDSMGMKRTNVLAMLRKYLDLEHQDKRKKPFDFTGWIDYVPDDTPQQENCYDCGVFTCQFLETLSRGEEEFAFQQKDMPYLRRKMVWEIARTSLEDSS